ncbi:probable polygalacturonase At1g80170 [Phoenix dactylifera]|uniref:Probable polygalacturonase At1g80170 n=1 Tax=Phoenix dactylifera TaxID=42345 RepID=A0A8B9AF97_PHODC|nr:probable polygalacturonase At1g80170 [Phoenix dactylifera]
MFCLTCVGVTKSRGQPQFNVLDFKAVGDGHTDDTQVFKDAWAATCGCETGRPRMIIPARRTFLVLPTVFDGPCKSTSVSVQLQGTIVAPDTLDTWNDKDASEWLRFDSVRGLTFAGSRLIDGRGHNWWAKSCKRNKNQGLRFDQCNDTVVSGVSFVNGPQMHLTIYRSGNVNVTSVHVTSPATSPNTDGIHVQASWHVHIQESVIGTGDDCISIGDDVYDIVIEHIKCGPGHGISVGSLGKEGSEVSVEEIHVSHVEMFDTTNGARIKTWQGGKGSASRISFEHINLTNVHNPIIIDQYYCDSPKTCEAQADAVHISDVTFAHFTYGDLDESDCRDPQL